ncbi:predicted protein [Naegleria gruberi]|uniref:Predicted protein n=1 Tax=Naegleria gruberi TaxID=5762 RepID=D2W223_NAEGR|nr:uncharacterized protein NAEGRDRAFT_75433 [Naegleria gruberi]EFC36867.1 predicted protein [Naegleria gruberi]|eukprot:XP_002669611.1 predicted protein [Naegleria gruberi strain NEG-M]
MCYYNFFRFKLLENVWVPNKVYEIELKKKRLHELLFREIERHVKIYQFNMTNASTKKPCLKNTNYANNSLKTYGCYMDYVLENLGPNLSKYGSTIEHTMSIYAIHFEELILSVHKHEVTNLSWTICHLAQDQSLQDKVRKEIFQFQDELKNQMTSLISQKTDTEEYLSKFDHLNGVMNDNNFDEPRKELLEGIHTLKKEDLDLLNRVNSMDETPPTTFSANDISDPFASHTSLDTIPSESIGTLSSAPSSPVGFVPSPFSRSNDELKENTFPSDQDTINYTEEQIITGELIPPHYLNVNRTVSPSKTEQLTLPNMDNLSLAAQAPMQSIAQSKNYDFNVETISPDLVHKGLVQKKLLFNALFVESVLSSSFDKQFESMHHSGLLNPDENNLRLLDACFKETTRQYSLKFMTGKTTKLDFRTLRYFNYDIPSGQFVSIVPYFSHHSKEYFPFETHTYRPERFLELYHPDEKEETPTIEVSNSDTEKQQVLRGGPSEVSELSFNKSNSIEEDRSLMNKLRVDQAFTQYGYVPCKSHQQIVKNGESIESNTSVLLDTCLGCNFIHLSSRVFVIELLTHYKVEIPQWQKADVSSNRYLSSESHDCAFPIHPVALVLNPFL